MTRLIQVAIVRVSLSLGIPFLLPSSAFLSQSPIPCSAYGRRAHYSSRRRRPFIQRNRWPSRTKDASVDRVNQSPGCSVCLSDSLANLSTDLFSLGTAAVAGHATESVSQISPGGGQEDGGGGQCFNVSGEPLWVHDERDRGLARSGLG